MSKVLFVALITIIVTSVDVEKCNSLKEEDDFGTFWKRLCCERVQF